MGFRVRKAKKPKPVVYELIDRDSVIGHPMYQLLDGLVAKHHRDLEPARIALAWCTSWKPDVDGRITLGKCKRATDLDKELAPYDFIILLRRAFWRDDRVTDHQRAALLDHELCHMRRKYEANGDAAVDERDRPIFRMAKHDLEEFIDVVRRYGTYKNDLQAFAKALQQQGRPPYKPCAECHDSPGWIAVTDLTGTNRVTRCVCWTRWMEQGKELAHA